MAEAPIPEPSNGKSADSPSSLLYRLVKESPAWVRIVVVLVLAAGIAGSVREKMAALLEGHQPAASGQVPVAINIQNGPYPPPDGSKQVSPPGSANNDPKNVDATHHVDEDTRHSKFHQDHPEDNPELRTIAQFDEQDDISYKFYAKTDRCVWVIRHENGIPISQFLRDPAYRDGVAQPIHSTQGRRSQHLEFEDAARLLDSMIPSAAAADRELAAGQEPWPSEPAQAGCANPHPGPFNWWWGPPQDQCWSPMYRQWKDGCTHFQMFNRCANAWDGRIVWVSCNSQHYW